MTVTSISFSEMVLQGADVLGGGIWPSLGLPTNGPGCPTLAFTFGRYRFNSTSPGDVTAMACVQGLEEVRVDTTFQLPDITISTDQPPVVDESSARWIASDDFSGAFLLSEPFALFNASNDSLDGFMATILFGTEAIPANELTGPSNADRFVRAVQRTYREFMAQVINFNMREPIEKEASRPRYAARVLDSTHHMRLMQNN